MTLRTAFAVLPLLAVSAASLGAAPERPLTSWRFVSIDGQRPLGSQTSLRIYADRITANVGCNTISGALTIGENQGQMQIDKLIATRMHCHGLMQQEQAVSELLASSPAFYAENGRLGLRSDRHIAELEQVSEY